MMSRGAITAARMRGIFLGMMVFYIALFWVLIILDIIYWLNY